MEWASVLTRTDLCLGTTRDSQGPVLEHQLERVEERVALRDTGERLFR